MNNPIDYFLNRITMYRLTLWSLVAFFICGAAISFTGILPFTPIALLFSGVVLLVSSVLINMLLGKLLSVPINPESSYITGLILALIMSPVMPSDIKGAGVLFAVAAVAMASKYLLTYHHRPIFNPAALGAVVAAFVFASAASWWVATLWMLPVVLIGGLLMVRKLQRFDLVLSFLFFACVSSFIASPVKGDIFPLLRQIFVDTPALFFAFVMLTEPITTPSGRWLRVAYGSLIGILFTPIIHIGAVFSTPELALLVGNVFSCAVNPKDRALLTLQKRSATGAIADFVFSSPHTIRFSPGQYMEWTLPHKSSDSRGVRRYFTIASSPTEGEIRIGVRFFPTKSTFKQALDTFKPGDKLSALYIGGDFTLPKDKTRKLAFIAGGIGITPFRSMVKYLLDTNEQRDVALFYSSRDAADVAYRDVFDEAQKKFGMKTLYAVTDATEVSHDMHQGPITKELLMQSMPDYKERLFYISGPRAMIDSFKEVLGELGIPPTHIKTDFFPGFV